MVVYLCEHARTWVRTCLCVCVWRENERDKDWSVFWDCLSVFILRSEVISVTFAYSCCAYFDGGWKPFFFFSRHSEGLAWLTCVWLLPPGAARLHHRLGLGAAAAVKLFPADALNLTACLPLHIELCSFQIYDSWEIKLFTQGTDSLCILEFY